MKKFVAIAVFIFLFASLHAQEMISIRDEQILPEKGNWAVMFDAVPFMQYAGNAFNGSNQIPSATAEFPNGYMNTLVLKKMKSETRALRIKLRVGFSSDEVDSTVVFLGGPDPEPSVKDVRTVKKQNIVVGIGTQKARGKGRVQGYFGKEFLVGFSSGDTVYTYGGGSLNQYNWIHTNTFGQGQGVTSVKQGNTLSLNFHLVFGVEYFFAPKMSLSAEYSWGLGYRKTSDGKKTQEQWDFSSNRIRTTSTKIPGSSYFAVDNDNNAGSINLAFYF